VLHLTPSLINDSAKTTLEPDIVLKDKSVGAVACAMAFQTPMCERAIATSAWLHPNLARQVKYVRHCKWLRLDEQLVGERIEWIDATVIE